MSRETFQAIKAAVQAHIDDVNAKNGDPQAMLLDIAVGYATLHHDGEREQFTYNYIADDTSTPHSSVGLFAMAAGKLDMDLDPDQRG